MEKGRQPEKKNKQKQKTKNSSTPSLDNTSWWDNPEKILPGYTDNSIEPPLDHNSQMLVFFWLTEKPQEFVEYIKANPESIFYNPYIQTAFQILRTWCVRAPNKSASKGRNLLKKVGFPGFIPKGLPRRKTNSALILVWSENPIAFFERVEGYKKIIGKFVRFPYGRNFPDRDSDIKDAFEHIYGKFMPEELITEDRCHDMTSIALSFIAYEFDHFLRDNAKSNLFYKLRKFYRSLTHFD